MEFCILENQKIPADLTCSICLEVLWIPMEHKSCNQMFCKDCLEPCAICPLCRDPLNVGTVWPITIGYIMNILYEIKVKCMGCEIIMTRKETIGHECRKKCPADCGKFILANEMEVHKNICINRIVTCKATDYGCSWSGKFNQKVSHQENCEYVKAMPIMDDYLATKLTQLNLEMIDLSEYNATKYRLDEIICQLDETKKQLEFQLKCSDRLYYQLLDKDTKIISLTEELEIYKSQSKDMQQQLYDTQAKSFDKDKQLIDTRVALLNEENKRKVGGLWELHDKNGVRKLVNEIIFIDGSKKLKVRNIIPKKSHFSDYEETSPNVFKNRGMSYVFHDDGTGSWYNCNGVKVYTMYKL